MSVSGFQVEVHLIADASPKKRGVHLRFGAGSAKGTGRYPAAAHPEGSPYLPDRR
jgi:hypothetical protein